MEAPGIEPRTSCMLGRRSATELYPPPLSPFLLKLLKLRTGKMLQHSNQITLLLQGPRHPSRLLYSTLQSTILQLKDTCINTP